MVLTEWHLSESNLYPVLVDKESNADYVMVRKNVRQITRTDEMGELTLYQYEEKFISREDWKTYEDLISTSEQTKQNTADIEYIAIMTDVDI